MITLLNYNIGNETIVFVKLLESKSNNFNHKFSTVIYVLNFDLVIQFITYLRI